MAGKLQNEDSKTLAELTGAGGAMSQLLNDTKIYLAGLAKQLSTALSDGSILVSSLFTTKGDIVARSASAPDRLGVGTDGQVLTADSAQTLGIKWATPSGGGSSLDSIIDVQNLSLATSVAANAMTIALKTKAGTDPTGSDIVKVGFRNATLTNGTYNVRSITAALGMTISAGASLGHTSGGIGGAFYVYLIDNAGTPELAVSSDKYDQGKLVSTTAMSAGATSATAIYSTVARASVPVRLIGRIVHFQTTAGNYVNNATEISTGHFEGSLASYIGDQTTYLSTTTYNVPNGVGLLWVEVTPGGGGGGGCSADGSSQYSGMGGGGSMAVGRIVQVTPGQQIIGTVGAGGGGGNSAGTSGAVGGTSSFGSLLSVVGARGGRGAASPQTLASTGGGGGTGGFGGGLVAGSSIFAGGTSNIGGGGGGGEAGVGGNGGNNGAGGAAAANTGGGGGGAGTNVSAASAGGAGGSGRIKIIVIG
jgi:hypothetical protein